MASDRYIFRILRKELGMYSTAGITLDEQYAKNYSEKIIERAKELKAKNQANGKNFSDEFYLDYAKSLNLQDMIGGFKETHKNNIVGLEIQDKDWAGYSYEEIIEMENNGYKIPEEVLQWAHAQQEADVTDYVIVSDGSSNGDTETADSATGKDDLSKLRAKAKQNITKAENAQKETEQKLEQYELTADKAREIKNDKQDSYKESINEITNLTNEWKKLDTKKNSGALSELEKKRYADLAKQLNGSDGSLMREIKADNRDLDEFLTTLDGLNNDININIQLAKDTVKSGLDLSNFEKNYFQGQLPHVTTGIRITDEGLLSDTTYGVQGAKMADLAIEKGTELESFSNNITSELNDGQNAELNQFASEYSAAASQTEENTKNAMGEEFDKSADETQDKKSQQQESATKQYGVDISFTAHNAMKAAATTVQSTTDLTSKQTGVHNSNKSLKKELKKTQNDVVKLAKESAEAGQKHEENLQREEEFLVQLEDLQGKAQTGSTESKVQEVVDSEEKQNEVEQQQEDTKAVQGENNLQAEQPKDNKENEKQTIVDNILAINGEDQKLKDKVKKSLSKGLLSNVKSQKVSKTLTAQSSELTQRNNNAQDVAQKTLFVGMGTFAKSFLTTAVGNSMFSTGVGLMTSPFTYASGLAMTIAGQLLQNQGLKEFKFGAAAAGTGTVGLVASAVASEVNSDAKTSLKSAARMFKANNQVFKESAKSVGDNTEVNATENTTDSSSSAGNTDTENQNQVQETITNTDSAVNSEQTVENTVESEDTASVAGAEENTANQPVEPETVTETDDKTENEPVTTPESQDGQVQQNPESNAADDNTATNGTDNGNSANKQDDKQKDSGYSVSSEFTTVNSLKAAATTIQASKNLENNKAEIDGLNNSLIAETKKSKNLVKNIEKESAIAKNLHQNKQAITQSITQQMDNYKNTLQNAQTPEEAESAQSKMDTLSTELDTTIASDEQTTTVVNKTLASSIQQLGKFKKNTSDLNKGISSFKNNISNQSDVSLKTITVGIGTSTVGLIDSNIGTGMMISGLSLMSNPFTFSVGAAQLALGEMTLAKGILEMSSGAFATATGTAGLIVNAAASDSSNESESTVKSALSAHKEADKDVQDTDKEIKESEKEDIDNTQENNAEPEVEPQNQETEENEEVDITNMSASAAVNANLNNTTTTDDKADRKLSRFNMDSIIESKKKKKKVMAVSASSSGRTR